MTLGLLIVAVFVFLGALAAIVMVAATIISLFTSDPAVEAELWLDWDAEVPADDDWRWAA